MHEKIINHVFSICFSCNFCYIMELNSKNHEEIQEMVLSADADRLLHRHMCIFGWTFSGSNSGQSGIDDNKNEYLTIQSKEQ